MGYLQQLSGEQVRGATYNYERSSLNRTSNGLSLPLVCVVRASDCHVDPGDCDVSRVAVFVVCLPMERAVCGTVGFGHTIHTRCLLARTHLLHDSRFSRLRMRSLPGYSCS